MREGETHLGNGLLRLAREILEEILASLRLQQRRRLLELARQLREESVARLVLLLLAELEGLANSVDELKTATMLFHRLGSARRTDDTQLGRLLLALSGDDVEVLDGGAEENLARRHLAHLDDVVARLAEEQRARAQLNAPGGVVLGMAAKDGVDLGARVVLQRQHDLGRSRRQHARHRVHEHGARQGGVGDERVCAIAYKGGDPVSG